MFSLSSDRKKQGNLRQFIAVFLLALLLFLCACKQEAPPAPPELRARHLIELFDSLKRNDFDTAKDKIATLQVLDPSNIYIPQLEAHLLIMETLHHAEELMAEKKFDEAKSYLAGKIDVYGHIPLLTDALAKADHLQKLFTYFDAVLNAENPEAYFYAALTLYTYLAPYNPPPEVYSDFKSFAQQSLLKADLLVFTERDRFHFNLYSDYLDVSGSPLPRPESDIISALMEIRK